MARVLLGLLILGCVVLPQGFSEEMLEPLDPKWHACADVSDCTLVQGFCGQPEAVNKNYTEEYTHWVQSSPPTHCALMPPVERTCVECQEQRCFTRNHRSQEVPGHQQE